MKEHIWPEDDRPQFDDVFERTVDPDRDGAIEDRYGCVRYSDETGASRLATHYYLPAIGLQSDELLRQLDPAEYEALARRIDRRRGDQGPPWVVLVTELDADDQAALLGGLGLTVEQARQRSDAGSPVAERTAPGWSGCVRLMDTAIGGRWHRALPPPPRAQRYA